MIKAEIHTDDRKVEVTFDATPYFNQASDADIVALHDCGWGGDYPSDNVAIFCADINPEVAKLFNYLEIVRDQGFECNVDEASAILWLKENRKKLIRVGDNQTFLDTILGGVKKKNLTYGVFMQLMVDRMYNNMDDMDLEKLFNENFATDSERVEAVLNENQDFILILS